MIEPPRANAPSGARARLGSASRGDRALAGVASSASLALLITASMLSPSPDGHGTHEQLGLPPCTLAMTLDRPCPTCGMTTAFAHAANADLLLAVATQPMGACLALTAAVVFWGGLHVAATGSRLGDLAGRFITGRWMWGVLGLFLASWAYTLLTW